MDQFSDIGIEMLLHDLKCDATDLIEIIEHKLYQFNTNIDNSKSSETSVESCLNDTKPAKKQTKKKKDFERS